LCDTFVTQVLTEWRLVLQEEKHLLTCETSSLERECIGKVTDKGKVHAEMYTGLQFIDHPVGVEALFNEAGSSSEKLAELGGDDQLDRRKQAMRAAVSVELIVRTYHTLMSAYNETRVLAAIHTARSAAHGVQIANLCELEPIDWENTSRKQTRLEDIERPMVPRLLVPTTAPHRMCLAAAQFKKTAARMDFSTMEGIRDNISAKGLTAILGILRLQWIEAAVLATVVSATNERK
jgi:hypothetical protein